MVALSPCDTDRSGRLAFADPFQPSPPMAEAYKGASCGLTHRRLVRVGKDHGCWWSSSGLDENHIVDERASNGPVTSSVSPATVHVTPTTGTICTRYDRPH